MSETKDGEPTKRGLKRELTEQMLSLLTSGFGVVAALAWNDAIQSFVKEYVEPLIPGAGLISKFIYAILITIFIIIITYQLSVISARLQPKD